MLVSERAACCGCGACSQICPVGAIKMLPDEEGFLYPQIEKKLCKNCGLCENICAFQKELYKDNEFKEPLAFAVKHKDLDIRMNSRSGGCFTALSDFILDKGGTIYGCGYAEDFQVIHKRAETKEERDEFRGSKYVQSNLLDTFSQIKEDLKNDKYVLFSGTSCQAASLKKFLEKVDQTKLFSVDIVCHGVPSPRIWKDYLKFMGRRYHGKITAVEFRNKKKFGWKRHVETISVNGKNHNSKIYTSLFYSHFILRPSCHVCPYKGYIHPADVTLADFWGISKAIKGFSDNHGVSLVLLNNEKGKFLFQMVKSDLIYEPCRAEQSTQKPLKEAFPVPDGRNEFWKLYRKKGFMQIVDAYGGFTKEDYRKEQLEYYKKKLNQVRKKLKLIP